MNTKTKAQVGLFLLTVKNAEEFRPTEEQQTVLLLARKHSLIVHVKPSPMENLFCEENEEGRYELSNVGGRLVGTTSVPNLVSGKYLLPNSTHWFDQVRWRYMIPLAVIISVVAAVVLVQLRAVSSHR